MLSFGTMYRNQMIIQRLESKLIEEKDSKKTMKIDGLKQTLRELFEFDKEIEKSQNERFNQVDAHHEKLQHLIAD